MRRMLHNEWKDGEEATACGQATRDDLAANREGRTAHAGESPAVQADVEKTPISDEEIRQARHVGDPYCICDHQESTHDFAGRCHECECDMYEEAK